MSSWKSKEFATLLADQTAGDYQASQVGWSGRVDPDGNIHQFMTTGGGINDIGLFRTRRWTACWTRRAPRTTRPPARRSYDAARDILNEELPIVYLYHQTWIWALDDGDRGLRALSGRHDPPRRRVQDRMNLPDPAHRGGAASPESTPHARVHPPPRC